MKLFNLYEAKGVYFTPEEDDILFNMYGKRNIDEIAHILKRSKNAITQRVYYLRKHLGKEALPHQYRYMWTKEEEEELIKLWATTNKTASIISKEMGINFTIVKAKVNQLIMHGKLQPRSKFNQWAENDIEVVRKLWNAGATAQQIAWDLGIKSDRIKSLVKYRRSKHPKKWERRRNYKRSIWTANKLIELQELADNGFHFEEMAEYLATTTSAIVYAVRKYEIKLPSKRRISESFSRKLDLLFS